VCHSASRITEISNEPILLKLAVMIGPANRKSWLTFGGAPVPDTDFGSLFDFPHHCRIEDFRRFISIFHTVTFSLGKGHCGACRRKWRLTDTDLCPRSETQTTSHIVESCPLTKLNGGLSRLHSADEDTVSWLTNYG